MKLIELSIPTGTSEKLKKRVHKLQQAMDELNKKELPDAMVQEFNQRIETLNQMQVDEKKLRKKIGRVQHDIVTQVAKKLKIVPKNYYRNLWLAIGMSAFGIPMGVSFGASLDNMAFIGIGLPIGMAIGIAIGAGMDKKAKEEGRQLNLEIEL